MHRLRGFESETTRSWHEPPARQFRLENNSILADTHDANCQVSIGLKASAARARYRIERLRPLR